MYNLERNHQNISTKMVAICCVCGIEKGSWQDFNLTFHSFPKNEDLRLQWYETIGKKVYRNACVCSKHFKTEDYRNHEDPNLTRRLLKPSAIPDSNLCRDLESVKNYLFNTVTISVENNNEESVIKNKASDDRFQHESNNESTKINDPITKRILNDEEILYFTVNQQPKKRKTEDCYTSQSIEKQEYLNIVSGIVRKEDFKNVNAWLRFQKYINEMRKQYKFLLHKNRRLRLKLNNFKDILDTLKIK